VPGRPAQYYTSNAGRNCVVNENGPFFFTLPPGNYRLVANYFPGNNYRLVTDVVANIDVTPAPPRRRLRTATTTPTTAGQSASDHPRRRRIGPQAGPPWGSIRHTRAHNHAGIRGDALRHLMRVAGGRDAGADIQELPESGLGGQVPSRPAEEGPVGAHR
jgi:hypothetical protein